MAHDDEMNDNSDDARAVDALLAAVAPASAETRDAHLRAALHAFDAQAARRVPRIVSLAAAVVLVFGVGATSGWVVRDNNMPADAQPTVRSTPTTEIPCHQLFPSINYIGTATPVSGEAAVFLDTRSTPEAIVLVNPSTCIIIERFDLVPPGSAG